MVLTSCLGDPDRDKTCLKAPYWSLWDGIVAIQAKDGVQLFTTARAFSGHEQDEGKVEQVQWTELDEKSELMKDVD